MIFATLILAVALLLSVQMICATWRDIHAADQQDALYPTDRSS